MDIKLDPNDIKSDNLEEEDLLFFATLISLKKEMLKTHNRKITIFEASNIFSALNETNGEFPNFSILAFKNEEEIK